MTKDLICPKCSSENVIFSKKRGKYLCEDCLYEFDQEKSVDPLRIFLSYGHDSSKKLVRCIKTDLEKRGHDVWFDKTRILPGDDWRCSITDGITKCHRFMSFLSKHSTRDPGVCLDEIAIAIGAKGGNIQTILVENEKEVMPPSSISHIQWLDMHDWQEQNSAGETVWKNWYQEKLAEIVRVVESDESRRFAGEIRTLEEHLKPISSVSRISQLLKNGLVGRGWLIDVIEKWYKDEYPTSRIFWLLGAPGVGKSAFVAHLAHFGRDKVIAVQFCEWDKSDHRNAQRVIRSIAFQIATRLPDYRKLLLMLPEIGDLNQKQSSELFDYLILNPLRSTIDGGRQRYLIVIDALDEAREDLHNPLADIIASHAGRLPEWIRIVITSRPEKDVTVPLQHLKPFVFDAENEENRSDIRNYLHHRLSSKFEGRQDVDNLIENILHKSEGAFLYAEHICNDILFGYLSIDGIDTFPQGLGQVFLNFLKRQFPPTHSQGLGKAFLQFIKKQCSPQKTAPAAVAYDLAYYKHECRPFLELISAAQEPLDQKFLSAILGLNSYDFNNIADSFGSLLRFMDDRIRLSHKSLTDWLCDNKKAGDYWIDRLSGHRRLAVAGMEEYQKGKDAMHPYFREHLPMHLTYTCRWDDLILLINSNELELSDRWTARGYQHEGLICLHGLVNHITEGNRQSSYAAGLITQIAGIYSSLGKYKDAEAQLIRAQAVSDDRRISSIALHECGSLYLYKGDLDAAYKTYENALSLCLMGDPIITDEAAANLLGLASIRLLQYKYDDVYALANDALEKAKDSGDITRTIAAHRILATAWKDNMNFDKSEEHLNMADMLAEFDSLLLEKVAISHLRAWLEYTRSILSNDFNLVQAMEIFQKTINDAKKCSYIPYLYSAKLGLAWCFLVQYDPGSANTLVCDIEQSITQESSYDLIIGTHLLRAAITHQRGQPDAAEIQYREVIRLGQLYHQKSREAEAWVGLGTLYWHGENVKEAESCWQRAKSISRQCSPARAGLILKGIERSLASPKATPL